VTVSDLAFLAISLLLCFLDSVLVLKNVIVKYKLVIVIVIVG